MARRREKRAELHPTILPRNLQFSVGVPIGHEDVKFRAHGRTSGFVFANKQSPLSPIASVETVRVPYLLDAPDRHFCGQTDNFLKILSWERGEC